MKTARVRVPVLSKQEEHLRKSIVDYGSAINSLVDEIAEIRAALSLRALIDSSGDLLATGGYQQQITGMGRSGISATSTDYNLFWANDSSIPERWVAQKPGSLLACSLRMSPAASQAFTYKIFVCDTGGAVLETHSFQVAAGATNHLEEFDKDTVPFEAQYELAMQVTTPGTWTTTIAIAAALLVEM